VGEALSANSAALAGTEFSALPEATLSPTPAFSDLRYLNTDTISRRPVPLTTIPDRPRAQIVTYIVQSGDTVYDIATQFGLLPETLVWSNREGINDAPWLIQPGLELFILPVDGVYYTVVAGDTVESIAAEYEVEPTALYNEWNDLGDAEDGAQPREGQLLVVPGGKGEEVTWTPPPRYPSPGPAGYSYGVCSGAGVTGPGANGWFIYPTGSPRVSGWAFHDARNPTHIGLDYACRTGDPIVAADNGVVTIAGWSGGYGILIEINHGNGFVTRYGHFSQLAVGCGQAVYQGDLLGYCGSTGWSTGAHLHFEIRSGGSPQDPQAYLP
jgi:LysM repeat protein